MNQREKIAESGWPINVVADRHDVTGKWVLHYLTDAQAMKCKSALNNAPQNNPASLCQAPSEAHATPQVAAQTAPRNDVVTPDDDQMRGGRWKMSNYTMQAKNLATDEIVTAHAIDNYYGVRRYGYAVEGRVIPIDDFEALYERVENGRIGADDSLS